MNRLWLLPLLGAMALPCTAATLYSWTDAAGVQHFTDSPPPASVNAKAVKMRSDHTLLSAQTTGMSDGDAADPSAKKSGPALARAAGYQPEDIARNCKVAQNNLSILEAQQQAQEKNQAPSDPETTKSLNAQLDKAHGQIQFFCPPGENETP